MLASLLFQLVRKLDTVPDEVIQLFGKYKGRARPTVNEFAELLGRVSKYFTRCFIILDALDECVERERETLLPVLGSFENIENINFLFTSRKESDIETSFLKHRIRLIPIQDKQVATDVELYVSESMENDEKLKHLKVGLKEEIIATLVQGAKGM